jgi:hypothetical protein
VTHLLKGALALSLLLLGAGLSLADEKEKPKTKILLIGKDPDHPYASHEYLFTSGVLAKCLKLTPGVETVVSNGWPKDKKTLEGVKAVVVYSNPAAEMLLDGKGRDSFEQVMKNKAGLVTIHWASSVNKGNYDRLGPAWMGYLGGTWVSSVGLEHGRSKLEQLVPEHPICRGWKEYEITDEFYHDPVIGKKATALLRVKGKKDKEIVVGWAFERPEGGRSFGTTLGHPYSNFKLEAFRRMIVNAILWSAQLEVPRSGAPVNVAAKDLELPPQKKEKKEKEIDLTTKFAASDPDFKIQGEYEGEVMGKGKYGAQVVAKGDGKFEAYFLAGGLPGAGWDAKTRVKAAAVTKDKVVSLSGSKWTGTIGDGKFAGKSDGGDEFTLKRVERKSPTLGEKPPEGAVVLFDGKNADEWNGGKVVDGNLLYRGTTSKKGFGVGKLHIEFRTPYEPKKGGQGRGNSGVYVLGKEIQVLDSFGLEGKIDECGAFYSSKKPSVNLCLPPLTWQTYDVEVKPDDKGDLKATVWHNGVKIHEDYAIAKKGAKPSGIHLQDHSNAVVYRNVWMVPATSSK